MNKHLALIPITGLILLTLAGCATTPSGAGGNNNGVTNSTTNTTGTNIMSNSAGTTNNVASNTGTATNSVQVSAGSTTTSQSDSVSEIALIKNKGYTVNETTPNATVKTSSGAILSAWLGVSGRSAHNQFVFFFLNGRYLGTDTANPSVEITSAKAAGNGIAVTYPVYSKNDSFADPTGTPVTITYTWNGSKLIPNKPYPKQFQTSSTTASSGSGNQPLSTLSMVNSNTGWATGDNSVWLTTDGGVHWKNASPQELSNSRNLQVKVFGLNDKQAWIAVTKNSGVDNTVTIFRTSDGGQTWSEQKFSDVGDPVTLRFRDSNEGWIALMQGAAAGSESETIYYTNNGGTTWNKVGVANDHGGSLPFGGDKTGASFVDQNHGWATGFTPVTGRIYLYQTINGGKTWKLQDVTVPSQLKNTEITSYPPIFFSQQEGILPVSDGSTLLVYRTTNGGQTWFFGKPVQSTVENEVIQAWSFPTFNDGFATDGNKMLETTDGGQTWSSFTPNISLRNVSELKFTSSAYCWALMNSGFLYHSTDGGHTWTRN